MKKRKTPMRMCVGCREMKPKKDLIRVVRSADGGVPFVDRTSKAAGRGAYICKDVECLNKAVKSNALSRALEIKIDDEITTALEKEIIRSGLKTN